MDDKELMNRVKALVEKAIALRAKGVLEFTEQGTILDNPLLVAPIGEKHSLKMNPKTDKEKDELSTTNFLISVNSSLKGIIIIGDLIHEVNRENHGNREFVLHYSYGKKRLVEKSVVTMEGVLERLEATPRVMGTGTACQQQEGGKV